MEKDRALARFEQSFLNTKSVSGWSYGGHPKPNSFITSPPLPLAATAFAFGEDTRRLATGKREKNSGDEGRSSGTLVLPRGRELLALSVVTSESARPQRIQS